MYKQSRAYILIVFTQCLVLIDCAVQVEIPQLINYSSTACEEIYFRNRRKVQNRILNYTITDSSHVYKVFVATNGERNAEGDIEFKMIRLICYIMVFENFPKR